MKTGAVGNRKNSACPPVLYAVVSSPLEDAKAPNRIVSESRRVSVPVFIERRLLCPYQDQRQGDPPQPGNDRSGVGKARARAPKRRAAADRPLTRQTHTGRTVRSFPQDHPASEAEDD